MQQEYTGDDMSMQGHTVTSDSSQRHAEICSRIQMDVLDCREEIHLGEHADVTPLQQHIVITFTVSTVAWEMRDGGWLTNSWRSYFRLYWMIGIR
jgi:hypothetical protein